MSTVKGLRAGSMALVLIGMTLAAATAGAEERFTTERPSSVLIFPKVVNTSDTVIQITNATNLLVNVSCFYINGQSVGGRPIWQITDFGLVLTRQQPTQWAVGEGRAVDPTDANKGLDPGLIPPVPPGFTGELVCVEVMPSGEPSGANSLKGEATLGEITTLGGSNGVSKYNAIGIQACGMGGCGGGGMPVNDDNVLALDNVEYAKCPGGLIFNFASENGPDEAIDGAGNTPSVVSTNLTLVPCGLDLENFNPASTVATLDFRDEFENPGSVSSLPVDCWFSEDLGAPVFGGQLSVSGMFPTFFGSGILRPMAPGDLPVLGVANVLRTAGDGSSDIAATNLHFCTDATSPADCDEVSSEIRLPSPP